MKQRYFEKEGCVFNYEEAFSFLRFIFHVHEMWILFVNMCN